MTQRADPPAIAICPVCGKPAAGGRLLSFCSARCADVDLGRWLTGQYRVAGPAVDEDGTDEVARDGSA
jgi:endogenous inhibitor of DNA gyrase (YacG/DUF329 family)